MTDPHVVEDQSAAVALLADPATHGGAPVARIDTHGAILFLAGERVCKLKRAVRYPYMDFSTPALREAACRAEVALNRRTAPQLYLGVAPLVRGPQGGLRLGDVGARSGNAADWVVVMHRFDQAALFDAMAERGALTAGLMDGLAEAVAALHADAERHPEAGAAALRWVVEENLAEFAEAPALFPPDRVACLRDRAEAALDRVGPRLDRRARDGFVRRCHGDLHLHNVVLLDRRPALFDCIEFNDALAVIDVLYDLAFLLMDLEHRGLRPFANRVFNRYLEITADVEGLAALPLFLSTRAAVRAKVARSSAATLDDAPPAAAAQRRDAVAYFDAALRYLEPPRPVLVAVGGLSGSGKTTVARALAPDLGPAPGAVVVRSDVIRKRMLGVAETERLPEPAYKRPVTRRVYDELRRRTAAAAAAGQAAIADAVYAAADERADIEAAAAEAGVPFAGIWLDAPEAELFRRVGGRSGDASDADAAIVARQRGSQTGEISWARIDAGGDAEASVALAGRVLADIMARGRPEG